MLLLYVCTLEELLLVLLSRFFARRYPGLVLMAWNGANFLRGVEGEVVTTWPSTVKVGGSGAI